MPIAYLRSLTAPERTLRANRHLGVSLCFIAGAVNAGGFLAVGRYTSHMTGVVSTLADDLVLGEFIYAGGAFMALLLFLAGAATSAILINWARLHQKRSQYALPLLVEAGLLLLFGLMGANLHFSIGFFVPVTVGLLCFIMGLQNAIITKVSRAEIRTTHVTGLVTDIGIELGKMLYWNNSDKSSQDFAVFANRDKLRLQLELVLAFFGGGVIGALGFKYVGYISTLPLSLTLLVLAAIPMVEDAFNLSEVQ